MEAKLAKLAKQVQDEIVTQQNMSRWSDTVTIAASAGDSKDEPKTLFVVHRHYLRRSSEFFRAALSKPWEKTPDMHAGHFPLSEFDPILFSAYLHWLYGDNNTISFATLEGWDSDTTNPGDVGHVSTTIVPRLFALYERASYLRDELLMTAIMRRLEFVERTEITAKAVLDIWKKIPHGLDLHIFFLRILSERADEKATKEWSEDVVREVWAWQMKKRSEDSQAAQRWGFE